MTISIKSSREIRLMAYLVIIYVLMGCQKRNIEDNLAPMLAKTWKMHDRTILSTGDATIRGSSESWHTASGLCYAKMLWTYKPDGSFYNELPDGCSASNTSGLPVLNGKWEWKQNSKTLKVKSVDAENSSFDFKVIELTPTKLLVQQLEKNPVGDPNCPKWLCEYWFIPN